MLEVFNYTVNLTPEEKERWFSRACYLWRQARREGKNPMDPEVFIANQNTLIKEFLGKEFLDKEDEEDEYEITPF